MADPTEIEKTCGLETYSTEADGTGGDVKTKAEDFVVEEIPPSFPDGERYLIYSLRKTNLTTFQAVSRVASGLHTSKRKIGYAGLKDRNAVTTQYISLRGTDRNRVESLDVENIDLEFVKGSSKPVKAGDLRKNDFVITIRNIQLSVRECRKRLEELRKEVSEGILNFYGLQRFGGNRPVTHLVGRELLLGNFTAAVWTYLTETFPTEPKRFREGRQRLREEKDLEGALDYFPEELNHEREILEVVSGAGEPDKKKWIEAFKTFPESLRRLFVHAYQSYIFNASLSELYTRKDRFENFPAKVVGYETRLKDSKFDRIVRKRIGEDGIKPEDFGFKDMEEVSSKGTVRPSLMKPALEVKEVEEDGLNPGSLKVDLNFTLKPGRYATVVLREITKS